MTAPVRFLAVVVAGWALFRGMTFGHLPGAEAFSVAKAEPRTPSIVPTEFPPLEPVQTQLLPSSAPLGAAAFLPYGAYPPYPILPARYVAALFDQYSIPRRVASQAPTSDLSDYAQAVAGPSPSFYSPIPPLDEWPLSRIASSETTEPGVRLSRPTSAGSPPNTSQDRVDRFQLSTWALLREQPAASALANGGTLGGSQAGARLTYAFNPQLAASLRSSSPVGGSRGGELAAGLRTTPFASIPISITAERRQAIGAYSTGRSAFALLAEGGIYQRPLGWNLMLDGYGQAGIVGLRSRDFFADGGFTILRPVYGRLSIGMGAWGGYQPGIYRIDAGPRLSMRVRRNIRVDVDWRQRVAGAAEPGSGPALTLAADF